jgi:polyisoprenoid-binding protein YceI
MKHHTLATLSACVVFAAATADATLARQGDASVSFTAVGPAGFKIVGTTSELNVGEQGGQVAITVPLANLHTGISLRDSHMKEKYLQVGTYPTAQLTVDKGALKFPGDAPSDATASGTMTLHGQSKPVGFHYHAAREGGRIHVVGDCRLNMNDFGVNVPSYLGVTVKPDVSLAVDFFVVDS